MLLAIALILSWTIQILERIATPLIVISILIGLAIGLAKWISYRRSGW